MFIYANFSRLGIRNGFLVVFSSIILFFILIFSVIPVIAEDDNNSKSSNINKYEKLKVFSEVLSLIESSYVEKVDSKDLIEGAIHGLVKILDPHSSYMPVEKYKEMKIQTSGKFGGLGIEISIRDGVLTVISPIEGTPAFEAGIQPLDKIIKIEDESTLDMTLNDAVSRLRGEIGTAVNITIFRKSLKAPLLVKIVRDVVTVESVKKKIYNSSIGYIKIKSFSKNTSSDLDKALSHLRKKNITKLILDVRNNPGGLLNQAVEVSDRFLKNESLIVYTKGKTEEQNMSFTSHDKSIYIDYPMIILVNGGSASASEIVAGALQDLGRAIILGTNTFGKGSVQTIIPLSDGSALRLTTARYFTPGGKIIQENGIIPDIIIENKPIIKIKENNTNDKPKNTTDKDKIRRFLRERDLKKHLEGKSSIGETEKEALDKSVEDEMIKIKESSDLEKDSQLRHAVSLLSGWDVMVNGATKNKDLAKPIESYSQKF
jgi:carboxyl-terminal processing protease